MAKEKEKELTLEQAIKIRDRLIEEIGIHRQRGSNSDLLKARNLERNDLAYLVGTVKYDVKRGEDGKPIKKAYTIQRGKRKGEVVTAIEYDKDKVLKFIPGKIHELASQAQKLKEVSNLGKRFSERTFETFDMGRNKQAFLDARFYADKADLFEESRNCLIILGGIGTGKTHLASAITNRFCERNIETLFATWEMHLQRLRDEIREKSINTYLGLMQNVQVLVLDDIGREKKSEWTESTLYSVINYRYEHMLPTIITTNLTDSELFSWVGGDVASRFKEMATAIRTQGEDYRQTMRK